VIVIAVHWTFRLSAANVHDLLAERGLDVSQQGVVDRARKFGILLAEAGRCHAKRVSRCWYVGETYVWVGKTWAYLYRAVDKSGQIVDVLLREKHDLKSAEAFFEQAIKQRGVVLDEVITDKYRAYLRAVRRHAPNAKYTVRVCTVSGR
jgi:transposase-like protein